MNDLDINEIKEKFLKVTILVHFIGSISYVVVGVFIFDYALVPRPESYYASIGLIAIPIVSFTIKFYFNLGIASIAYLTQLWMYITIIMLRTGGMNNPIFTLGVFLIYAGYFIFEKKGFLVSLCLVCLSIVLVILNETIEFIPIIPLSVTNFVIFFNLLTVFVVVTVLLLYITNQLIDWVRISNEREVENQILISELESAREQISQAQKMEAIGRMAGGLSHDFNNLLTGIVGHAELAKLEADPSVIQNHVKEIREIVGKASHISHELLSFSRKRTINPIQISINEVIEKNFSFVRTIIRDDIKISYNLNSKHPLIYIDVERFEQAYYNLLLNSVDAMPQGGEIVVRTYDKTSKNSEPFIGISIEDQGRGIDLKDLDKIFDPFFTTKDSGTGLGLSSVYGFVTQSNGFIEVINTSDKGTTIEMVFPHSIDREIFNENVKEESRKGDPFLPNLTVMIVDDNREILKVLELYFKRENIEPLCFDNSVNAREKMKEMEDLDLLITDQVMPELNGTSLIKFASQKFEKAKFILMSGYLKDLSDTSITDIDKILTGINYSFIQKPFDLKSIRKKIVEILDR